MTYATQQAIVHAEIVLYVAPGKVPYCVIQRFECELKLLGRVIYLLSYLYTKNLLLMSFVGSSRSSYLSIFLGHIIEFQFVISLLVIATVVGFNDPLLQKRYLMVSMLRNCVTKNLYHTAGICVGSSCSLCSAKRYCVKSDSVSC